MEDTRIQTGLENDTWTDESGQAVVSLVLMIGIFLIAVMGFGIDLTNAWFHRQAAVAAADSACQAGGLDMLSASGGYTPPGAGFTVGTASDCVGSPSAVMCKYAGFNGYTGGGLVSNAPSNAVSWSFPSSVNGVTAGAGANSFLKVNVSENVKQYFTRVLTHAAVTNINVSATCGVAAIMGAAPMIVLHPTMSGAFNYANNGGLIVVGGPNRSLQVNSSSPTAITWSSNGILDLSQGGPSQTGSNVGVTGGPSSPPGGTPSYSGGSTGVWRSSTIPIADPYASVPVPASVKNITPSLTTSGKSVAYHIDGCPDTGSCTELSPGYYPNGIKLSGNGTVIFDPGVYYLNGSLSVTGGATLRVAKPASGWKQTDGVMFYFFSGSMGIGGNSGTPTTTIDNVASTDLTCDGSPPPAALNMPSTLPGNVLYSQCTKNGTYWDPGGDTTDVVGSPGSRGLLIFQDHSNSSAPSLIGSGSLAFSGSLYFHSTGYNTAMSLGGGGSSGSFMLGEIVADQVSLTGNGLIKLALNPAPNFALGKVAMFQ